MGGSAITGVINPYDSARKSVAGDGPAIIDSIKAGKVAASTKVASAIGYVKTNGIGGTAMNALSALKNGASSGISAAWASISNVIMGAGRALLFVGRAALMNPIGLAITALVVGGAMVFKYWEPIKAFFSGFWQGLKEGMAPLSGMFDRAFGALKPILEPLKPVWDWVISAVKTTFDWVGKLFAPFESTSESMKKATENGKGLGKWLGGFVVTVAELAGKFFGFGANIIGGLIDGILSGWDALKALISKLAGMLPDVVANKLGIRSIVAINQADIAMKGRYWNHRDKKPERELIDFLESKSVSVQERVMEATGIKISRPVYYSAEYNYNIDKLLDMLISGMPNQKRKLIF